MSHLNDYLIPCKNKELNNAWTYGDPIGGGLPAVTAADDGKVLTVIDGSWGAGETSGGGILKVTNSDDILDHTWTEIYNALY